MSWRDREAEMDKSRAETDYNSLRGAGADMQTQGMVGREFSDEEKLAEIFSYHPPNKITLPKYEHLRSAAKYFASVILLTVPPGADRTCALRHVRDAVMTANAGVSLDGLSF